MPNPSPSPAPGLGFGLPPPPLGFLAPAGMDYGLEAHELELGESGRAQSQLGVDLWRGGQAATECSGRPSTTRLRERRWREPASRESNAAGPFNRGAKYQQPRTMSRKACAASEPAQPFLASGVQNSHSRKDGRGSSGGMNFGCTRGFLARAIRRPRDRHLRRSRGSRGSSCPAWCPPSPQSSSGAGSRTIRGSRAGLVRTSTDRARPISIVVESTTRKSLPESSNRLRITITAVTREFSPMLLSERHTRRVTVSHEELESVERDLRSRGSTWILTISSSCSNQSATGGCLPEQAAHHIRIRPFQEAGEFAKVDLHRGNALRISRGRLRPGQDRSADRRHSAHPAVPRPGRTGHAARSRRRRSIS